MKLLEDLLFARFPARASSGWELTGRLLGREAARMWEKTREAARRSRRDPIVLSQV